MSINSNISGDGNILTIAVRGRFDFSMLAEFKKSYEPIVPKPSKYIIDLKEAEYLDSSALGMLLSLRDYAGGDNCDIQINNCNPDVKKILIITKLDELFSIS